MEPVGRLDPQPWMADPATRVVMDALNAEGSHCRFVGGAVRDALLGRAVTDVDLATDLKPDAVATRLRAAGVTVVPTGLQHGTVTAVTGGRHFEITTLRVDVETFGRHATVAFGTDWQADAERRDFTMNALYLDADGTLYDPTGGRPDLERGHVRFVGDPATRIAEDYLRVLRFFRFQAHLGRVPPDQAALIACRDAAPKLIKLSAERIRAELMKLFAAPEPTATARLMAGLGILASILPEATAVHRLDRMVAAEHALGEALNPLRRLAALLETRDAPAIALRLRLSNAEATRLADLLDPALLPRPEMPTAAIHVEIYRGGATRFIDRALLAASEADATAFASPIAAARAFQVPKLPIAGRDLVALGVPKGPRVGQLLRELEQTWIASSFSIGRDALLAHARTLL